MLTAIAAESASTGNPPRHYVVHDPAYAFSPSSVVVFDGVSVPLVPGPYGAPGTNYSAGNPDWAKLRLDPDRFRVSGAVPGLLRALAPWLSAAAADVGQVLVGAADFSEDGSTTESFVQTAGILSDSRAFVVGDYPAAAEGSVAGLIKDPGDPVGTAPLVDGASTGGAEPCPAGETDGYAVPELASGGSVAVSKPVSN